MWETFHRAPSELRSKCSSQAGNLIPIESGHTRAAERGENRVHSRSVLKFREAEVGVLVTKVLSASLCLAVIYFRRQVDLFATFYRSFYRAVEDFVEQSHSSPRTQHLYKRAKFTPDRHVAAKYNPSISHSDARQKR